MASISATMTMTTGHVADTMNAVNQYWQQQAAAQAAAAIAPVSSTFI